MLSPNQINRLILNTEQQIDSLEEHNLQNVDPDALWYRKGFVAALKLVLHMNPSSISNKPINKEKPDARPNVD